MEVKVTFALTVIALMIEVRILPAIYDVHIRANFFAVVTVLVVVVVASSFRVSPLPLRSPVEEYAVASSSSCNHDVLVLQVLVFVEKGVVVVVVGESLLPEQVAFQVGL